MLRWWHGCGLALLLVACSFDGQSGCSEEALCPRGETCMLETAVCEPTTIGTTTTEANPPASFQAVLAPFFRGEICSPTQVRAGDTITVALRSCLHPCLEARRIDSKHQWSCAGSQCDAIAVAWWTVDAGPDGCPDDVFSRFDSSLCAYTEATEVMIHPIFNGDTPVVGTLSLEIPFLTNADADEIATETDAARQAALLEQRYRTYPIDPNRFLPTRIDMQPEAPAAPTSCIDHREACTCYEIGF